MRILIAPMAALAEMSGPMTRAQALALKAKERGHRIAFCAAEDYNYHSIEDIKNYYAPIPSPFGTPLFIGKRAFKTAQALGLQQRRKVRSFEEVLHIVGAINGRFFPKDVRCLREAIRDFGPDVVYAEFRIAAIVAAKLEGVKVLTGYSFPVQKSYACNPEYSGGVKEFLKRHGLSEIESVLEIFDWADLKIVASSHELEPMDEENVVHVGSFIDLERPREMLDRRNYIIAYIGNGTVTHKRLVRTLVQAFTKTGFQVYIATRSGRPFERENFHVDHRFDFGELMPQAIAYINHGGQNSIMASLVNGVPQIIFPGNVFERQYNAASVKRLGAGVTLGAKDFTPTRIRQIIQEFERDPGWQDRAKDAGEGLLRLGGVSKVLDLLEEKDSRIGRNGGSDSDARS